MPIWIILWRLCVCFLIHAFHVLWAWTFFVLSKITSNDSLLSDLLTVLLSIFLYWEDCLIIASIFGIFYNALYLILLQFIIISAEFLSVLVINVHTISQWIIGHQFILEEAMHMRSWNKEYVLGLLCLGFNFSWRWRCKIFNFGIVQHISWSDSFSFFMEFFIGIIEYISWPFR